MAASPVHVTVTLGDETRLFTVVCPDSDYDTFINRVREAFRLKDDELVVFMSPQTTADNVECLVPVRNAGDLVNAARRVEGQTFLKVRLLAQLETVEASSNEDDNAEETDLVKHYGIECDYCGMMPIIGNRYKCMECENFDLCYECEHSGAHPASHMVIKMKQPQKAYDRIVTVTVPLDHQHTHTHVTSMTSAASETASTQAGASVSSATTQAAASTTTATTQAVTATSTASTGTTRVQTAETPVQTVTKKLEVASISTSTPAAATTCTVGTSPASAEPIVLAPGVTLVPASTVTAPVSLPPSSTSSVPPNVQPVQTPSSPMEQVLDSFFLRDVTLPDNTKVHPGAEVCKQWELKNSGTVAWPEGTVLSFVGGAAMGHPDGRQGVAVPAVAPGESAVISLDLIAPHEQQTHIGYYRLRDATGRGFGHRVWVQIDVEEAPSVSISLGDYAFVEAEDGQSVQSLQSYSTAPSVVSVATDVSVASIDAPVAEEPVPADLPVVMLPPLDPTPLQPAVVNMPPLPEVSPARVPPGPVPEVIPVAESVPVSQVPVSQVIPVPVAQVPADVVDVSSPSVWAEQQKALADMGFYDGARNLQLLRQYNGNMNEVVSALLS